MDERNRVLFLGGFRRVENNAVGLFSVLPGGALISIVLVYQTRARGSLSPRINMIPPPFLTLSLLLYRCSCHGAGFFFLTLFLSWGRRFSNERDIVMFHGWGNGTGLVGNCYVREGNQFTVFS